MNMKGSFMHKVVKGKGKLLLVLGAGLTGLLIQGGQAFARDVEYKNTEIAVHVNPGEPTQIQFPGEVTGGFKKSASALSIQKKDHDLIVFANEKISDQGEAIIVRLKDGRSYSVRVHKASGESPRDDVVRVEDGRGSILQGDEEEDEEGIVPKEKKFDKAPPTQVAGLMREMVLAAEFGKSGIPGYRVSERHKGEAVLSDGTIQATIDKIFIGPNLWGYVIDAKNMLDQTQKINPAAFRLDGTRAISVTNWELSPRPINIEEQISGKHNSKVYIITKAR